MNELKYADIKIGDKASFSKTISESDIYNFAGVSGDFNPVHINEEFAKNSLFKTRIAHGFLGVSFISTVLGTKLPGPNTIYLSQELQFKAPVKIGDTLTAECEVLEKTDKKKILKLKTTVFNQTGTSVIEGIATVLKYEST
ncbi:MAG: MaoC family dehydratase [Planctomycetota bacterium]|nr:MaoC family dehydratase [Planctomycetota bacterium]MDI6787433.1 MaoC family dehydratase [Planctomycetota bacterium]